MPELPEVETIKYGLQKSIVGQRVIGVRMRRKKLRYEIPGDLPIKLLGEKIVNIDRRAKYLLIEFEHGQMIVHFGMSGYFSVCAVQTPIKKHDHVLIDLANGQSLRYNDTRRFGLIDWTNHNTTHRLLAKLGPEPLAPSFNPDYLQQALKKTTRPIKLAIMDNAVVVGVGNIYANESLFMSKIHPQNPANTLRPESIDSLCQSIKTILTQAVKAGGTTLADFQNADGKPGYFKQSLSVYGRANQPCLACNTALKQIRLAQRTTVYCPNCQALTTMEPNDHDN